MRSGGSRSSSSTIESATPSPGCGCAARSRSCGPSRGIRSLHSFPLLMNPIQVGLLGSGTVGRGTFEVLRRNEEEIRRRAGRAIRIAMVADLDTEQARRIVGAAAEVVDDARMVIANPAIDIVIELIGGVGVARALVLEAIAAGKH